MHECRRMRVATPVVPAHTWGYRGITGAAAMAQFPQCFSCSTYRLGIQRKILLTLLKTIHFGVGRRYDTVRASCTCDNQTRSSDPNQWYKTIQNVSDVNRVRSASDSYIPLLYTQIDHEIDTIIRPEAAP
jgi:hypothetical protein